MKPTIKDVAREAGVSPKTVSWVLNNKGRGMVSPATAERVREAARKLHYQPDIHAQRLGRRSSVGVKTLGIGYIGADWTHPYQGEVLRAAATEMGQLGYHLVIATMALETAGEKIDCVLSMTGQQVDGWLLSGRVEEEVIDFIVERGIPAVFVGSYMDMEHRLPQVRCNDALGGYLATRHLLELGHQRIAFLGGRWAAGSHGGRLAGYREALAEWGLQPERSLLLINGGWEDEFRSLGELLRQARPTAFFVTDDELAAPLIGALHRLGLKVPEEVSVVGYDDTDLARLCSPPLTTVRQPRHEVGRVGFRQLWSLLNEQTQAKSSDASRRIHPLIILPVELVVRASTAPPSRTQG